MPSQPQLLLVGAASLLRAICYAAPAARADTRDECRQWADAGECDANEAFMSLNCATSCLGAKSYKSQMKRECEGYAAQGECSRNPAFMLATCRSQCEAWEKEHGLKIDRDAMCVEWSLLGKCVEPSQRAKMATQCNTSCTVQQRCARSTFTGWSVGICDKVLRCEARDKQRDCRARAAAGGCTNDARRMAIDCLQSCAEHDVDAVLSAQRPEMRAILSPLYDLPSSVSRNHERCWLPGWSGHNTYKLMLPTSCAAPSRLPWQRSRVPRQRATGSVDDALTCPFDTGGRTPRVGVPTRRISMLPHTPPWRQS